MGSSPLPRWWPADKNALLTSAPSQYYFPMPLFYQGSTCDYLPNKLHSYFIGCYQGSPNAHKHVTQTSLLPHVCSGSLCVKKIICPMQFKAWLKKWTRSSLKPLPTAWPKIPACERQIDRQCSKFWSQTAQVQVLPAVWPWACHLTFFFPSSLICKTILLIVLSPEVAIPIKLLNEFTYAKYSDQCMSRRRCYIMLNN